MRFLRTCYYKLIKKMSDVEQIEHFTGFGLYDKGFIDVLRNLGESGDKQIGVISHVDLVKDGIPNHIEVIPVGNGRSRIVGAGVEEFKRQNLSA